jgi:hypothetical protein
MSYLRFGHQTGLAGPRKVVTVTYSSYGKITRCSSQACGTTRQCEDESYGSQLAAITHYGLASFGFPTQVGPIYGRDAS